MNLHKYSNTISPITQNRITVLELETNILNSLLNVREKLVKRSTHTTKTLFCFATGANTTDIIRKRTLELHIKTLLNSQ